MMRVFLRWVLPTLAVAVAVHFVTVFAVPRVVMEVVMDRVEQAAHMNTPLHAAAIDASARNIPLPSPDLLYSSCALDLRQGPVLVSVTPGDTYLSLALFDTRSDNVFVTDDQTFGHKPISLLVLAPGQAVAPPEGIAAVQLGDLQGLLLLRGLAATAELAKITDQARHSLVCRRWVGK